MQEIVLPAEVPKFVLNISASPYRLGCDVYERFYQFGEPLPPDYVSSSEERFVNACMQVPTIKCQKHEEVYACYKSSRNWAGNNSIAELCRKHLGMDSNSNFAGFIVQICVHREEQMLIVESFVNLSFSNETFKKVWNFSISLNSILFALEKMPIFFIEFGNGSQQSAIREKTGGEIISDSKWNNENDGIGSVLNDIEPEKINGTWAKKLHFVPPSTDDMKIYFQIANPEFSKLITRRTNLMPYENNPNITNPTTCDEYGDDCEPIRELLIKIEELQSCRKKDFKPRVTFDLPPWKPPPPFTHEYDPFMYKASETLLCDGDLVCDKEELQKMYNEERLTRGRSSSLKETDPTVQMLAFVEKLWHSEWMRTAERCLL
ncbi:hypothetical protein GPALN_005727 [Globodera pallida]|nr:hypothetical protein GPALN_005727 [Globodera pallida]